MKRSEETVILVLAYGYELRGKQVARKALTVTTIAFRPINSFASHTTPHLDSLAATP